MSHYKIRNLSLVCWIHGLLVWGYVVAFQISNPASPYWQVAQWLPWLRMDYFGEAGFIVAFASGVIWALTRPRPGR